MLIAGIESQIEETDEGLTAIKIGDYKEIIHNIFNNPKINKAFDIADSILAGLTRRNKSPYIAHPYSATKQLQGFLKQENISPDTLEDLMCAILVHDNSELSLKKYQVENHLEKKLYEMIGSFITTDITGQIFNENVEIGIDLMTNYYDFVLKPAFDELTAKYQKPKYIDWFCKLIGFNSIDRNKTQAINELLSIIEKNKKETLRLLDQIKLDDVYAYLNNKKDLGLEIKHMDKPLIKEKIKQNFGIVKAIVKDTKNYVQVPKKHVCHGEPHLLVTIDKTAYTKNLDRMTQVVKAGIKNKPHNLEFLTHLPFLKYADAMAVVKDPEPKISGKVHIFRNSRRVLDMLKNAYKILENNPEYNSLKDNYRKAYQILKSHIHEVYKESTKNTDVKELLAIRKRLPECNKPLSLKQYSKA